MGIYLNCVAGKQVPGPQSNKVFSNEWVHILKCNLQDQNIQVQKNHHAVKKELAIFMQAWGYFLIHTESTFAGLVSGRKYQIMNWNLMEKCFKNLYTTLYGSIYRNNKDTKMYSTLLNISYWLHIVETATRETWRGGSGALIRFCFLFVYYFISVSSL